MQELKLEFPDISNYDIHKIGELALYSAHMDIFSLKGVIDSTKKSIDTMQLEFLVKMELAESVNDYITSCDMSTNHSIYSSNVIPLLYSSIFISLVAIMEDCFNRLCKMYSNKYKTELEFSDLRGKGLERAFLFLTKIAKIDSPKKNPLWKEINTAIKARNKIVHEGGIVANDNVQEFLDNGYLVAEENNQLLLEHDTLIHIYDIVNQFITQTFKKVN